MRLRSSGGRERRALGGEGVVEIEVEIIVKLTRADCAAQREVFSS